MARPLKIENHIIHALDVEDKEKRQIFRIVKDVSPYVDAIKISTPLIFRYGGSIIGELKEQTSLPIIGCFKVGDIPDMSRRIVKIAIDSGADGLTLHGIVGRDSMTACIKVAHEKGAYVFMVAEMSHPGALDFMKQHGFEIAKMARELGSDGIVAPATRPDTIRKYREIVGDDMWIMSPGVGVQGGKLGDAILAGATFEVVGHRIYEAPDPKQAAKTFCSSLKERLAEKQLISTSH
ncbi:MAG: orotidine-5'-phosphate decarboxylase [Thaumarchaeota archaeon]|nr:orotidine-5'-phosphate decarboxylase [Nitrososphaerota archaeon]